MYTRKEYSLTTCYGFRRRHVDISHHTKSLEVIRLPIIERFFCKDNNSMGAILLNGLRLFWEISVKKKGKRFPKRTYLLRVPGTKAKCHDFNYSDDLFWDFWRDMVRDFWRVNPKSVQRKEENKKKTWPVTRRDPPRFESWGSQEFLQVDPFDAWRKKSIHPERPRPPVQPWGVDFIDPTQDIHGTPRPRDDASVFMKTLGRRGRDEFTDMKIPINLWLM